MIPACAHNVSDTCVLPLALDTHSTSRVTLPDTPSAPVHDLEQPDQRDTLQVYAVHATALQPRSTAVLGGRLQWASLTLMPSLRWQLTIRRCVPPPHCLLHAPHRVYTSAYVGHGRFEQPRTRCLAPHAVPPCCALRRTLRTWRSVPPLHDLLQELALTHALMTQFTRAGVGAGVGADVGIPTCAHAQHGDGRLLLLP